MVVLTVTMAVSVVPLKLRAEGDQVQVVRVGRVPQPSRTTPLKLFVGVTVTVYDADWPALIACTVGVTETLKSLKKIARVTVAV